MSAQQDKKPAKARLENYVKRVVADAPPLSVEQREMLAQLLGGVARG